MQTVNNVVFMPPPPTPENYSVSSEAYQILQIKDLGNLLLVFRDKIFSKLSCNLLLTQNGLRKEYI